jgi:hypothetical protein
MIDGQAKTFEKDIQTSLPASENTEKQLIPATEIKTVSTLEMRVRQTYQLNKRKRYSKLRSSGIV